MLRTALLAAALSVGALATAAAADPWKDESGKGREYGDRYDRYDRDDDWDDDDGYRGRRYGAIPRGHLPPPGMCRVWIDGLPPGHQPPPVACSQAERMAARRGDARVIGGRGARRDAYASYGRRYRDDSSYRYERVCDAYGPMGECVSARLRPAW